MFVGLGMIWCSFLMIDLRHLGHKLDSFIEKIGSLITDQDLGATKLSNDVFIEKNSHLFSISLFYLLGFHPLGQIFDGDNDVLISLRGDGCKWSNIVNAPFLQGSNGQR